MNVRNVCWPLPNEHLAPPAPLGFQDWTSVILLSPHADDEALGCGGLLAALADANIPMKAILVSDSSGAGGLPEGADLIRAKEFSASIHILHPKAITEEWGLPDGALSEHTQTMKNRIESLLAEQEADTVLCPWPMDMHPDHSALGYAVVDVVSAYPGRIQRICFFEVWSPLPASHILDISHWWERKMRALRCHETALACGNYERAMRGLSSYRALLTNNMASEGSFAEAYCLWDLFSSPSPQP